MDAGAKAEKADPREAPLPDAAPGNLVDRLAPAAVLPFLKLARLDRPAGAWLLLLPGWQGICLCAAEHGRGPDLSLLARFALGAVVMRGAGCAYNDIVDRDIDAKVARTAGRPVASGRVSVRAAVLFVVLLCLLGLLVLLTMNGLTILLGVASLGLVAAYPFMKRITWWPQAWLGLTFNWGALMGFAAAAGGTAVTAGGLGPHPPSQDAALVPTALAPVLLYASGVFWTLGYDTIYALQDLEDDALAGVRSSARRLGARAPLGVRLFYALSALLAGLCGLAGGLSPLFFLLLPLFAAHLAAQAFGLRPSDPDAALRRFRSNREAGLLLALALAAGALRL
jgi:4-hydroxybenzoate polyprenyltransferase